MNSSSPPAAATMSPLPSLLKSMRGTLYGADRLACTLSAATASAFAGVQSAQCTLLPGPLAGQDPELHEDVGRVL